MESQPELIVLDLDGTLVRTRSGNGDRVAGDGYDAEADWEWIPGRLEELLAFRERHPEVHFAIATNQGGVAHGFWDADRISDEVHRAACGIGDDVFVSIAFGMP